MKVTIADDDFIDDCYGINFELDYDSLPIEGYEYVYTELLDETPPEYLNDDDHVDYSYLNDDEKVQFKDSSSVFNYSSTLSQSSFYIDISNSDFWFNRNPKSSIVIVNDTGITIERFDDITQNKFIKDQFFESLNREIERIESLEPFQSFKELFDLHQAFPSHPSSFWCEIIQNFYELISKKIDEQISNFKQQDDFKILAKIIFLDLGKTISEHFKEVYLLISSLSIEERKILLLKITRILPPSFHVDDRELYFYQFLEKENEYTIVSSIKYYHLVKLFAIIKNDKELTIMENKNHISKDDQKTIDFQIRLNHNALSKELFILVNTTASINNVGLLLIDIEYVCDVLINRKKFNPSREEFDKFNKWLQNESNQQLFKTYLNYASASSSRIIKPGHFDALANSISKKFQLKGFNKKTLLNYLNAKEPDFKLNNSNKSSFAHIKDQLFRTEKKLQNGTLKKMYREILDKL